MKTKLFINGAFVSARDGGRFPVYNPASGELIAEVADGGRADAALAVEASRAAFGVWSGLAPLERSRLLRRAYDLIVKEADRLAALLTREQGKPLGEAKGEVLNGAEYLNWYAEEARRIYGEIIPPSTSASRIWVLRQPVGVTAAITPWNFPSSMITRKVAPALAAGCTVVLKPATETPLSALALAELFAEAGLPAGAVNVIPCRDPVPVGNEFLTNPTVRKISFTGSTAVGKHLLAGAAPQVKRVSLELGGHAPFIVFDDADLDVAVQAAIGSKYRNAGQTCICANRIYVHAEVADAFTERMQAAVSQLRVGPGTEPGSQVGPLINEAALHKVTRHVEDARAKGAAVLTGGSRLTGGNLDTGFYFAPTLLAGVTDDMVIMQEETFGPVAPVTAFRTEEEVIARANASPYGLAAYVYTRNLGRTVRVGEALHYGMVAVNEALLALPQAPFGGVKESGLGREGGHHGLDGFLEHKYMLVGLDPATDKG